MRSIATALCLVATASFAQKTEPTPKPAPVQIMIFEGGDIHGTFERPTGIIYSVPPRAKFGSLIQVRMNFNDKLRESVHEM